MPHERDVELAGGFMGRRSPERQNENPEAAAVYISGKYQQTWSVRDDIADMLLSTVVQCIEEQFELLRRLATERWQ